MTEHEKYQEHIRHTHNAFCMVVIRHAAIDAARSIRNRRSREISLDYLIDEKHYPITEEIAYTFAEMNEVASQSTDITDIETRNLYIDLAKNEINKNEFGINGAVAYLIAGTCNRSCMCCMYRWNLCNRSCRYCCYHWLFFSDLI